MCWSMIAAQSSSPQIPMSRYSRAWTFKRTKAGKISAESRPALLADARHPPITVDLNSPQAISSTPRGLGSRRTTGLGTAGGLLTSLPAAGLDLPPKVQGLAIHRGHPNVGRPTQVPLCSKEGPRLDVGKGRQSDGGRAPYSPARPISLAWRAGTWWQCRRAR